jgi:RNA polymerase sigma-70 factor (ECF subfamily)
MLAVKRDDAAAFETLFRKYIHQIVGYCTALVGSRARAEEIAQDAFLQVYRTRHRYQPKARFSTWLYRIVTNLCLSETRRAERRFIRSPSPSESQRDDDCRTDGVDAGPGPEDSALGREQLDRLERALAQLPRQQRASLLLARVEGMSYAEIASALGCSVSAVKSLIHRATLTLKERLRDKGQEG